MLNKTYKINKILILVLLFALAIPYSVTAQLSTTSPWPKFHKDIRNTGSTSNFGTTVGKLKWTFKTGAAVVSSPILDNNTILYVGSNDNHIYAINADSGAIHWKYKTDGPIGSSPALDINGMLYIGSNDGYLYAFDTTVINPDDDNTWVPKWKYSFNTPPQGAISSPPTIDEGGNIIFGSNDGYLYSIYENSDEDGAEENWYQPIGTSWGCPAIDINTSPNRVFIGSWDADLILGIGYDSFYILNNTDGTRSTFDNGTGTFFPYYIPGLSCVPGGIQASPVLTNDGSVIVSWLLTYNAWPTFDGWDDFCDSSVSDHPIWKIDSGLSSGYTLPLGGEDTYSTPAMVSNNTYFVSSGPEIYKILPDGATYFSVATIGERSESSPAVDGQLNIFVGSNGGYFYAICADCPESPFLWQYPGVGEPPLQKTNFNGTITIASIISSPAIGNDDRHSVYVGASDGNIYAFYDGLSITGMVEFDDNGTKTPMSGVTVYLTDDTDPTALLRETLTATNGTYEFPGVEQYNTYTVSVEKVGYIFLPLSSSTKINNVDVENINFMAYRGKTISGTINWVDTTPVSGATVMIESSDGSIKESSKTNTKGYYEFNNLSYDTYIITPTNSGTGFTPSNIDVVIDPDDTLDTTYTANFKATTGYKISGTLLDEITGEGITDATVTIESFDGTVNDSAVTNSAGYYEFNGLEYNTYILTPTKTLTSFAPFFMEVVIDPNDPENTIYTANFKATTGYKISGMVLNVKTEEGIPGVSIKIESFDGAVNVSATTSAYGYYEFNGLDYDTYLLTPTKSGASFSPSNLEVVIDTDNPVDTIYTADFAVTNIHQISGIVSNIKTGEAIPGVSIKIESFDGTINVSATTSAYGYYEFNDLDYDTYLLTPTKSGASFSPSNLEVVIDTDNPVDTIYTADFDIETYQISGKVIDVTDNNNGLPGVTITINSGATKLTDSDGKFTFVGLSPGTYTLTANLDTYNFSPLSIIKEITSDDIDNVDFQVSNSGETINGYVFEGTSPISTETTIELYTLIEFITDTTPSRTTKTNENGLYSLIGVADGLYIIKPVLEGYSFDPATTFVTVLNNDQNDINFRGITGLSLSGKVTNIFGLPFSDIAVTLTGTSTGETTTDSSGQYIFTGLTAGQYTVAVSNEFYDLRPASITKQITSESIESNNFIADPICPVVYLNIPPFGSAGSLINIYGINFESRDQSNDDVTVTIGDTGVSVTPGVYFGYQDPSTWIKADVVQWLEGRILVDAPGGLGIYHVYVVITDEDGESCVYQNPFPTNIFFSY